MSQIPPFVPPMPTGPMSFLNLPTGPQLGSAFPIPQLPLIGATADALPYAANTGRASFLGALRGAAGRLPTPSIGGGGGGGAASLLSRFKPALTRGGALRGLGLGAAGSLASGFVPQSDGTRDDALRGLLQGAGVGAGVGSFVPGVGTALGAGIGAIGGGIHGLLTGGDSKDTERADMIAEQSKRLSDLMREHGFTTTGRREMLSMFEMQSELAEDKGQVKEVANQIIAMLPQARMADEMQRAQEIDARQRQSAVMAAQAWLGPMIQQQMDRSGQFADDVTQAMLAQANQITDPSLRASAQRRAHQVSLDNATRNAYQLQQMALTPQMYGFQTQMDNQGVSQIDPLSVLTASPLFGSGVPAGGPSASGSTAVAPGSSGDQLLAQILGAQ